MIDKREIAAEYRLAHWAGIMQERKASGLSISAYCKTNGIRKNVYFYWQRKLRETACEKSEKQKHQNIAPPIGWAVCKASTHEEKSTAPVSIEIGKFKLTANHENDMELFAKVCQALKPLC